MQIPLLDEIYKSIETELKNAIEKASNPSVLPFAEMMRYHMGWLNNETHPAQKGKRIRSALLLLITAASGGNWRKALPASAAVELIHNFSLVHDDIQDESTLRRGRLTVWKKWGVAHAINTGDALFILAQLSLLQLKDFDPEIVIHAGKLLNETCLKLTCGQFMDMDYASRSNPTIEEYWPMATGKTAALISASTQIGSLLGGASKPKQEAYRDFGHYLGIAYQVQDDLLGIWGDSEETGKSIESDLVTGKKSLPILYGLSKKGPFSNRWMEGSIKPDEVQNLADQLTSEGAKLFTQETADQMTDLALKSLQEADPRGEAREFIFHLVNDLVGRKG